MTTRPVPRRFRVIDRVFKEITRAAALAVLGLLVALVITLVRGAWPAWRRFGLAFFTTARWDPVAEIFGALQPVFGTVVTAVLALALALPISLGIAITLTELAPKPLRLPLTIAIELLAAVPSLIYGMWGLFVFAPAFARDVEPWLIDHLSGLPGVGYLFAGTPMGIGLFTSGMILAVMITPLVSSVARDVFSRTPEMLKESAYGLGATHWEVIWRVVVPSSRVGLVNAAALGLGRALGETMAVTFVIGNSYALESSLFAPSNTIASALANEFAEATNELHTSSLIALGFTLFLISVAVAILGQMITRGAERRGTA